MSIEVRNVSKNFNAFKALDSINLDDKQGDKTQIELSNTRIEPPQLSDEEQARFAGP